MSYTDMEITMYNNNWYSLSLTSYPICTVFKTTDNIAKLIFSNENANTMLLQIQDSYRLNSYNNNENDMYGPRLPKNLNYAFTQLVAVNNKTELFLYGGQVQDEIMDGIWRYSPTTKLWMLVGRMKFPRAGHTVTPVKGLRCP